MGKFMETLEKEESRKKYPKSETALHHAGFGHDAGSHKWWRWMPDGNGSQVYMELGLQTGTLQVKESNSADGRSYKVPDGVLEDDNANGLLFWLDKTLEPVL